MTEEVLFLLLPLTALLPSPPNVTPFSIKSISDGYIILNMWLLMNMLLIVEPGKTLWLYFFFVCVDVYPRVSISSVLRTHFFFFLFLKRCIIYGFICMYPLTIYCRHMMKSYISMKMNEWQLYTTKMKFRNVTKSGKNQMPIDHCAAWYHFHRAQKGIKF